jgi:hypothetical protein
MAIILMIINWSRVLTLPSIKTLQGYIISRRPEGCMFDPTLTPCDRYGSRCGENSVCSVQKYAPYYECSCADGFIGAAPKCVAKCDDGEREIKEFLAFVDYREHKHSQIWIILKILSLQEPVFHRLRAG